MSTFPVKYFNGSILSTDYSEIAWAVTAVNTAPTGGTYTLTAFTQTTAAISYSATAATVSGALNDAAMTGVVNRGGCTVSGDLVNGFAITFLNADLTNSATSLTPTGSGCTTTDIDGGIGRIQRVTFTNPTSIRDLYIANHGLTVADTLYIRATSGPTYYSRLVSFSIPDANTVRFITRAADSFAAVAAIDECGRRTKYLYEAGSSAIRCKKVSSFYLPGVTPGITTADDITLPTNQSDGATLVMGLLAGTGTINYQVGELTKWRDGPILSLTKTTINAADA